ncbi:MAG: hypothetical protein SF123_05755 [Chloroflexota bacterium]|nr:hypothetical protein [Chloroflexota bacterium]
MARLGCGLGVLLMVLGFVALFLIVMLPVIPGIGDLPPLLTLQGALFCPPGHTYDQEYMSTSVRPGETFLSVNGFCTDESGERRAFTAEQDDRRIAVSAATFLVPFLIGIFLFIFTIGRVAGTPKGTTEYVIRIRQ